MLLLSRSCAVEGRAALLVCARERLGLHEEVPVSIGFGPWPVASGSRWAEGTLEGLRFSDEIACPARGPGRSLQGSRGQMPASQQVCPPHREHPESQGLEGGSIGGKRLIPSLRPLLIYRHCGGSGLVTGRWIRTQASRRYQAGSGPEAEAN